MDENLQRQLLFNKLKGKPITMLVLFMILGGTAKYVQIEDWTDYSRPTVRKTISTLISLGLVEKVKHNQFNMTLLACQLMLFDKTENFFHGSSSLIINDSNIKLINTTTTIEIFSVLPEVEEYLREKGVWPNAIPEIAEIVNNDLELLRWHFGDGQELCLEGQMPTAQVLYRIRNNVPPPKDAWGGSYKPSGKS
jgi:hypothetical protein